MVEGNLCACTCKLLNVHGSAHLFVYIHSLYSKKLWGRTYLRVSLIHPFRKRIFVMVEAVARSPGLRTEVTSSCSRSCTSGFLASEYNVHKIVMEVCRKEVPVEV